MPQNTIKNTPIHSNEVHVRQTFGTATPSSVVRLQ